MSKLKKSLKSVPEAAVKSEATASMDQSSRLMRLSAKASEPTLMASWTSLLAWSWVCLRPVLVRLVDIFCRVSLKKDVPCNEQIQPQQQLGEQKLLPEVQHLRFS